MGLTERNDAGGGGRPVLGSITTDRNRDYEVAGLSRAHVPHALQ